MLTFFAASESGVPLSAEPVLSILGLHVTNSMVFGLLMAVIVVSLLAYAAKLSEVYPKSRLAFTIETIMEFVLQLGEDNLGSRKNSIRFMPLFLTLFLFILFSNMFALVPGVGSVNIANGGEQIPLLRAFTADLNATLAMAVLTIGTIQFVAIRELGIKKHLQHYFTNKPWNPMNMFLGLIEVMGEFIRVITLSMRLFGVIYAGEVLIHAVGILAGNYGWAATFPVYLMEIFFGLIQAFVFMILSMVYLGIAIGGDHSEDAHSSEPKKLSEMKV